LTVEFSTLTFAFFITYIKFNLAPALLDAAQPLA